MSDTNQPSSIIDEWLTECSTLTSSEKLHSYALTSGVESNEELCLALHTIFDDCGKYSAIIQPAAEQLFAFYRSRESVLRQFTLTFLPDLVYAYLTDRKRSKPIETLLLGVYNLDAVSVENGEPVVFSFRLPSLAQSSLYHEPTRESLTESALRRYEECATRPVTRGPHTQCEALTAATRMRVLTALMFTFNRHIAALKMQRFALRSLCRMASKIASQGFPKSGHHKRASSFGSESTYLPKLPCRIQVSQPFLLEISSGLYYAMYNDFGYMAMQAIEDIYNRACYQGYSDVILMTSAIRNSSHVTSTGIFWMFKGEPAEGPMGISVALSPSTTTVTTVNKSMITNASFRTKKLPDDIPIISGEDGDKSLSSITEDKEDTSAVSLTPRGSSLRGRDSVARNLQKLGIGKKLKIIGEKPLGKAKGAKSPLIHNGDLNEGTDSSKKRNNTVEDVELENGNTVDERLDMSPNAQKKLFSDHDDNKPIMQVSSV